jgi:hypothetical protein
LDYQQLDNINKVELINYVYKELLCPLQNYFCPSFKLKEKMSVGSKYKKTYELPQTPYAKIMMSKDISKDIKDMHLKKFLSLNPIQLQKKLINY